MCTSGEAKSEMYGDWHFSFTVPDLDVAVTRARDYGWASLPLSVVRGEFCRMTSNWSSMSFLKTTDKTITSAIRAQPMWRWSSPTPMTATDG